MVCACGSDATANWSRQASVEKRLSVSMSSCDMPTTVAPMAAKRGVASAKAWASMVQPWVKALGKKYSTTGPFLSVAAMSKSKRSEEHTSELQSPCNLVCRLLLEKKKKSMVHGCVTVK